MSKPSKRRVANMSIRSEHDPLPIAEAVEVVKSYQNTKFDETVEVSLRLGIDARQSTQGVRGAFSLPHGIGKQMRVIAFCDGPVVEEAMEAGAMEAGGEELAKKIEGGWLDFDVAIAHPSSMRYVGKLGRILGPQGKMPTPKTGTVNADVPSAVKEFVAGKVEFRNDAGGIVHAPVGKKSFEVEKLTDNITAFIDHVLTLRPTTTKGVFLRKAHVKATMSPSVQLQLGG